MNVGLLSLALVASGCAFGGSAEDPTRPVIAPEDAAAPTAEASVMDAMRPAPAARADAGRVVADGAPARECQPMMLPDVCDPVRNTGCLPLTQCDVDLAATRPSGRCVFLELSLSSECTSGPLSTTCAAQTACDEGVCRKLCYCDDDCDLGECCRASPAVDPSGAFAVCSPC